jgi:hypothetical protein
MKHIKLFENFDKMNEEISVKSIFPIAASLFISLNSFANGGAAAASARSVDRQYSKYFQESTSKIESDLERLKLSVDDPELNSLIGRIQDMNGEFKNLTSFDDIPILCDDLKRFAEKHDIYDVEISKTLNHLKKQDISQLKDDYKILLNKIRILYIFDVVNFLNNYFTNI